MAEESRTSIATLQSTSHIPIAQLTPLLTAPSSRSIKAVVTLKWPYSSATKSVAFLLAEPDFRLRRTRGQVRVQFSGSSAQTINKSSIESGDEVILCLDGVEFVHRDAVSTPGRGVEFELRFTERLLLESRQQDTGKVEVFDVNHPEIQSELPSIGVARITPEAEPLQFTSTSTPARPEPKLADDEFSSPAFIKRARTSYGSLWEEDFEAQDGSVKGKGRKRTRMSSTWTIASDGLTPEPEELEGLEEADASIISLGDFTNQASAMMDESVQTEDLEVGASEALLELTKQSINANQRNYETQESGQVLGNGFSGFQVPPVILTDLSSNHEDTAQLQPPSSPRLQPLSSDNLPLVSPLLSRSASSFAEPISKPLKQLPDDYPGFVPVSNISFPKDAIQDSDYASSSHRDHEPRGFQGLEDAPFGLDDSNMLGVEVHVYPEHQYGNWQGRDDQLGFHEPEPVNANRGDDDRFEVEEPDQHLQSPTSPSMDGPSAHYPNLDEALSEDGHSSRLDPVPESIPYPHLPDHGDNLDALVHSLSGPESRPMSRSVSAQSKQSVVIDLTEGDDDEEVEEVEEYDTDISDAPLQKGPSSRTPASGEYQEGSEEEGGGYESEFEGEEEEEEEEYDDENELPIDRVRQYAQAGLVQVDHEQDEDDEMEDELQPGEEYYDDDELDSQGNPYPPRDFEGDAGEFDSEEEEESYDESQVNYKPPARSIPQGEPVVIDLLSSDDEEDDAPSPPVGATAAPTDQGDSESELSDEDQTGEETNVKESLQPHGVVPTAAISPGSGSSDEEGSEEEIDDPVEQSHVGVDEPQPLSILEESDSHSKSGSFVEDESDEGQVVSGQIPQSMELDEESPVTGEEDINKDPSWLPSFEDTVEIETSGSLVEDNESDSSMKIAAQAALVFSKREEDISIVEGDAGVGVESTQEMEIDEVEDQTPTTPVSKQDVQRGEQSTQLAFSVDGAADDDERNRGSRSRSLLENTIKPSPRPSLFSRVFSIDGANDEPDDQRQYSTLPNEGPTPPSTAANSQQFSQSFGVRFPIGSAQLPTPDDTQLTHELLSRQSSFASGAQNSQLAETTVEASIEVPSDVVEALIEKSAVNDNFMNVTTVEAGVIEKTEVETFTEGITIAREAVHRTNELLEDDAAGEKAAAGDSVEEQTVDMEGDEAVAQQIESEMARAAESSAKKIVIETLISQEPSFTKDSPRRSHRRVRSTSNAMISKDDTRHAPVTPAKAAKQTTLGSLQSGGQPPMVVINTPDKPSIQEGHDASIEGALYSLESPEKHHDLRKPMTDLKLRLNRNLRTELEQFKSLKILRYELNKKLNVLAIATTAPPEPERVKNGPRHYLITFNITDPSTAPAGVTEVQIFRPYKEALPAILVGDGILLRDFQVVSLKNRGFGLKSDSETSSWAVFKGVDEVDVRGPPVEYGDGEKKHMAQMKEWYDSLDSASVAKLRRANGDKSTAAGV